jgi:ribosomal protein S27E
MAEKMNKISFSDVNITCVDCENTFVFSGGEQAFFASKALSPPKRCPDCRKRRKITIVPDINLRHTIAEDLANGETK